MDECAACGAAVHGATTYCDDCADGDGAGGRAQMDRSEGHGGVASPAERAVAALLAVAAVAGGVTTLESLSFLPEAIGFFDPLDTVGFLLNATLQLGLAFAFAVGAKRLADGTADADRLGRALEALAVLSVVLTGVAVLAPFGIFRWVPTLLDPGAIVVDVAVRYVAPGAFTLGPALVGIAGVGALVSFAAGAALTTDRRAT